MRIENWLTSRGSMLGIYRQQTTCSAANSGPMDICREGRRKQIPHPPYLQTNPSAIENYKGQKRAYQSRKREDEYDEHGTDKLSIETTRSLRRVAT